MSPEKERFLELVTDRLDAIAAGVEQNAANIETLSQKMGAGRRPASASSTPSRSRSEKAWAETLELPGGDD